MRCGDTSNSSDGAEGDERLQPARCKGCDGVCGCRQAIWFLHDLPKLEWQGHQCLAACNAEIKTERTGGL